jgi:hypothetical protein
MRRLIILVIFLLLGIAWLCYAFFSPLLGGKNDFHPLMAFGNEVELIIELNKSTSIEDKYANLLLPNHFVNNEEWQKLSKFSKIFKVNQAFNKQVKGSLFASYSESLKGAMDLVFVQELDTDANLTMPGVLFKEFLNEGNRIEKHKFSFGQGYEFYLAEEKTTLYFVQVRNLLIASFVESKLVEIYQILEDKSGVYFSPELKELLDLSNKKDGIRLYLNPTKSNRFSEALGVSKFIQNWGVFDVAFSNSSVFLNGLIQPNSNKSPIAVLAHNEPTENELISKIPSKIENFIHLGIGDWELFFENKKARHINTNRLQAWETVESNFESKYKLKLEKFIRNYFGDELVYFSYSLTENGLAWKEGRQNLLHQEDSRFFKKNSVYKGVSIYEFSEPQIMNKMLNDLFPKINSLFLFDLNGVYYLLPDYNTTIATIENLIQLKTLENDVAFKYFKNNTGNTNNFYSFIKLSSISNNSEQNLSLLPKNSDTTENFYGMSLQLIASGDLFLANIAISKTTSDEGNTNVVQKTLLKNPVATKPQFVLNHINKEMEVFVQDKKNFVYLISNKGDILWDAELKEPIVGDVTQVDYYKNGKLQYAFGTKNYIYLLDRNGYLVEGYPIKLKYPATNSLAVFDYEGKKDYRLFVACEDNNIYGYKLNRKPLLGWHPKVIGSPVYAKIEHALVRGKDYLVVGKSNGIDIFNRRGAKISSTQLSKGELNKDLNFLKGNTKENSFYTTTNNLGEIVILSLGSKLRVENYGSWSKNHKFIGDDLLGNGRLNYVFLDGDKLFLFDYQGGVIFSFKFIAPVNGNVFLHRLPGGRNTIGVNAILEDQIYLFTTDGNLYPGFPLKGSTPFSIGDLGISNSVNLVVGSQDNYLYFYRLN